MKLHLEDKLIQEQLFKGWFGLEKESLRVMQSTGLFASTPHPFNDPHIVQDFAENQTEINTDVYPSWKQARQACEDLTCKMQVVLNDMGEVLWPFSNPSIIRSPHDIPMLKSGSRQAIEYREYLESRYGRSKMVYSGIHYNFSFRDEMLMQEWKYHPEYETYREFKDRFYLDLVCKVVWYGWLIDLLFNASPVYDGSLQSEQDLGKPAFSGMSSMRNSALGYWNYFTPYFDYSSLEAYTSSIDHYVKEGLLKAPRELYYPIRIKPKGKYDLDLLNEEGINHIELRMVDLNPYEISGISEEDAWFCHLFLVYLACCDDIELSWKDQIYAQQNFKSASIYSMDQTRILYDTETSINPKIAATILLDGVERFFSDLDPQAVEAIDHQKLKLLKPEQYRLAARVRRDFANFAQDGLKQACWLQKMAIYQTKNELPDKGGADPNLQNSAPKQPSLEEEELESFDESQLEGEEPQNFEDSHLEDEETRNFEEFQIEDDQSQSVEEPRLEDEEMQLDCSSQELAQELTQELSQELTGESNSWPII